MILIIDYSVGNLAAVANMLSRVGAKSMVSASAADIAGASGIVLPGNGAFDSCVDGLQASGMLPALEQAVLRDRKPLLGICVGAQLLGHCSEEGQRRGLGWLDLVCKKLPASQQFRVPHMGWTNIVENTGLHPVAADISSQDRFYFTHSYYMAPSDESICALTASHGMRFAAAVAKDNLFAVQFHPEKSHQFGMKLMSNFVRFCTHD